MRCSTGLETSAIVFDAAIYGRSLGPLQLAGVALMGLALWQAGQARR